MITGNLSKSKELAQVIKQFPNHKFPIQIPDHNKTAYSFIGIRVKQGKGLSPILQIHQFCKSSSVWHAMAEEFKNPQSMGNYSQVIMIHNPELVKAKAKVKAKS